MIAVLTTLALCVAGGVGAGLRLVVDGLINERHRSGLPLGTLVINIAGSLALGVLAGLELARPGPGLAHVLLIAGTGGMGGFTTFGTASVEAVRLAGTKRPGHAVGYAATTVVVCVAAAAFGLAVAGLLG